MSEDHELVNVDLVVNFQHTVESGGALDRVRLLAIGVPEVATALIQTLHKRGFAEVGAWSKLLPGRHPGEVMSVFTWSIRLLNESGNRRKVR